MVKNDKKSTIADKQDKQEKITVKESFKKASAKKKRPKLMAGGDAHKFLKISRQRFEFLVRDYDIPFQITSAGKIFFLEDIEEFQKARKEKMKHRRKNKRT